MPEAPSLTINLPGYPFGNLMSAATIAALRALVSTSFTDGQDVAVDAGASAGDGLGGIYSWNAASTATDNGTTVIRPTDKTSLQAGRWLLSSDPANAPFTQTGTGAVARSIQEKLREAPATPQDFGAVGDGYINPADAALYGGTDDTAAMAAWLAAGCAGRPLKLPAGGYLVSTALSGVIANVQQRLVIQGDGAACTEIIYTGNRNSNALTLTGNMPYFDSLIVGGFRITTPDVVGASVGTGAALRINNVRNFVIRDFRTFRVGKSIHLVGCLCGRIEDHLSYYDRKGIVMEKGVYESTPNVIRCSNFSILAPYEIGIELSSPTMVALEDYTIEGLATENPAGGVGISIGNAGQAGAIGVIGERGYFENNKGQEIYISHVDAPIVYAFRNHTFNRITTGAVSASIVLDASAVGLAGAAATLDLRGSAFTGLNIGVPGGYVPNAATPYVAITNPNNWPLLTLLDDGTFYRSAVEKPVFSNKIQHPGMVEFAAWIQDNGSVIKSRGAISVSYISAGRYRITVPIDPNELIWSLSASLSATVGWRTVALTGTYIEVVWEPIAGGAAADTQFYISAVRAA